VFENRVLRRIFGPKRDEVTGGWRKLHNEDTELLGFRALSIVRILIITRKNNKHDVSETGSVSVLR
jgi:hypothetical protein